MIIDSISRKLRNETTTEYLDIWLQRLTITDDFSKEYLSSLCKKVYESNNIWNCSWSNYSIDENMIIDNMSLFLQYQMLLLQLKLMIF